MVQKIFKKTWLFDAKKLATSPSLDAISPVFFCTSYQREKISPQASHFIPKHTSYQVHFINWYEMYYYYYYHFWNRLRWIYFLQSRSSVFILILVFLVNPIFGYGPTQKPSRMKYAGQMTKLVLSGSEHFHSRTITLKCFMN